MEEATYQRLKVRIEDGPTLVFDGVCVLCNGAINWYYRRLSGKSRVQFMWLQHPVAQRYLEDVGVTDIHRSWAYIENGEISRGSTGWLRACRHLHSPWSLVFPPLECIPGFIREAVYDFIAVNRYRLFGKLDVCQRPSKGLKECFIHDLDAPAQQQNSTAR